MINLESNWKLSLQTQSFRLKIFSFSFFAHFLHPVLSVLVTQIHVGLLPTKFVPRKCHCMKCAHILSWLGKNWWIWQRV